jgi:peroxiredoxin
MTFVIGSDGVVRQTHEKVDVTGHAERVLAAVKEIAAGGRPAGE